jgi:hypothetical protein
MNVSLVADVEKDSVCRRIEDAVKGDSEFHHAEIRAKVTAGLREGLDEALADLLCQVNHLRRAQTL